MSLVVYDKTFGGEVNEEEKSYFMIYQEVDASSFYQMSGDQVDIFCVECSAEFVFYGFILDVLAAGCQCGSRHLCYRRLSTTNVDRKDPVFFDDDLELYIWEEIVVNDITGFLFSTIYGYTVPANHAFLSHDVIDYDKDVVELFSGGVQDLDEYNKVRDFGYVCEKTVV